MRLFLACMLIFAASCGKDERKIYVWPQDNKKQPEEPTGTVSRHGWLRVDGNKIVDKDGKPFQMKGFSLFWSQWSNNFYVPETVETHAALGATVVRAAMGVEMGGYLQNKNEREKIETIVQAAIDQDIYVIIDWHSHGQYRKEAKEFFVEMAKLYAETPNVIFELWNEPVFDSWDTVRSYSQEITNAIRAQDAKNLVIVGSPSWSQRVDLAALSPIDDFNTAYSVHFYAASHGQWLRDRVSNAMRDGIAIVVTEFGVCDASGNGRIDLAESEKWLTFLAANNISWANWSWFDKDESASALVPGTSPFGPYEYTQSGEWILEKL